MGGLAEGYLGGLRLRMAMQQQRNEEQYRQQQLELGREQLSSATADRKAKLLEMAVNSRTELLKMLQGTPHTNPETGQTEIIMPSAEMAHNAIDQHNALLDRLAPGALPHLDRDLFDVHTGKFGIPDSQQSQSAQSGQSAGAEQAGGMQVVPVGPKQNLSQDPAVQALLQTIPDQDKPRAQAIIQAGGKKHDVIAAVDAIGQQAEQRAQSHQQFEEAQASRAQMHADTMAVASEVRRTAQEEKSYQFHTSALDKIQTPLDQLQGRMSRLNDTLDQKTPQADALVAPELLTVMAGGQGSGLRMNEAEIARIVGGRSAWENLRGAIQHWRLDPNSARTITPSQDAQIRSLVAHVNQKLIAKKQAIDEARTALTQASGIQEHRTIYAAARKKMEAIDNGTIPASDTSSGDDFFSKFGGVKH